MKVIITGVCGFIGSCLARRLITEGVEVVGIDNLSRRGTEITAVELVPQLSAFFCLDLSHSEKAFEVFKTIGSVDAIFHLAAQVAVTTSYNNRHADFLDNAAASFYVLEGAYRYTPHAYCLYASTNKVYGHITTSTPVGLDFPLCPYTPYGVSKAAGELYFSEYAKEEFGMSTLCLRQSCIYGHHQYGVEDQGWMAWFTIANVLGVPVTVFGDGTQVRDLLYVDDLIDLYIECWRKNIKGVFPVGGGRNNSLNLNDGLRIIEEKTGKSFISIAREQPRPGDQPYFVADLSWTRTIGLEWHPRIDIPRGLNEMVDWIQANRDSIENVLRET